MRFTKAGFGPAANSTDYLYAANFHAGTVEIFDGNFAPVSLSNAFRTRRIPAGFAPFGLATLAATSM